jgi:trimethylguanosine synthase
MDPKLKKFYNRRYFYFSRYDMGIKIDDEEGWFSVTAEPIAAYTAYFIKKIPHAKVVDGCCCVGGNLIQFALLDNVDKAVGVELDETRKKYAINNCRVYEVPERKMSVIHSSISEAEEEYLYELDLEKPRVPGEKIKNLVFFFDPPWGGVDY